MDCLSLQIGLFWDESDLGSVGCDGRDGVALQMAESTKPEKESDLGETQSVIESSDVSGTERGHADIEESGACVKVCLTARVTITEEPGAGKSHAGICAGGIG
jgi:hypothetical protein